MKTASIVPPFASWFSATRLSIAAPQGRKSSGKTELIRDNQSGSTLPAERSRTGIECTAENHRLAALVTGLVLWYIGTILYCAVRGIMVSAKMESRRKSASKPAGIDRIQTGVRLERRLLKVLKALAEYKNMTLGDLLEGVVLHAFEGKTPFSTQTLRKIAELKGIYDLDLDARSSHRFKEKA